ncbi:uncharacterized protein LTHEOB_5241 [Lasiodiplodia theobromae]|uniref:uncharacterized protein n=1 Tax=Lasiodiplodia theobromae TaxID=45133 RepID=UPI0015C3F553|nr:uncharacterized protein LTHEOB_5241 [Lasiodiplodia theobromae]KAF4545408.1 hypothetical protein LTHEOB_5241 [Lasiodiplodia theobromae]
MKLLLQSLNVWAADPANAAAAESWEEGLLPATAAEQETLDALVYEKAASGTIEECTAGHRVNSANLYLVSTKNHPCLGHSFAVRRLQRLGSEEGHPRGERLTQRRGEESSAAHEQRRNGPRRSGGPHHRRIGYSVYIYDLGLPTNGPGRGRRRFSEALMIGRIIIGGGGNEGDGCRAMAVRWMVEVIAQQWMGLDGLEAARGPPLYFGEGCDQQEVRW